MDVGLLEWQGQKISVSLPRPSLVFDECVNYKDPNFKEKLKSACPDGVDIYWENVGGVTFDTVMPLLNDYARIPVCGLISLYNATSLKRRRKRQITPII